MPLSGNLGFVPLDEVLRLLVRADQTGSVEVRGDSVSGRIFVAKEGITIATVMDDQDLRQQLINSSLIDDTFLQRLESDQTDFASLVDKESGLIDVLREITIESIYQMSQHGSFFEVRKDASSPYGAPEPFQLEGILDDVDRRGGEWAEVASVVSDPESIIKMNRDLGNRSEITISSDAWKLLSELEKDCSVSTMASRLGRTLFWTARLAAEMAANDLLVIANQPPDGQAERTEDELSVPTGEASAVEVDAHKEGVDPAKTWWVDSEASTPEEASALAEKSVDLYADIYDEIEEDAEAFLEKVFSELDSQEAPDAEDHGLGRRRVLGPMLDDQPDID